MVVGFAFVSRMVDSGRYMTIARRTKRRTRLERNATEVINDLAVMTQADVAAKYSMASSSVSDFARRHRTEIEVAHSQIVAKAEDYGIADKAKRIGIKDALQNALLDVRESRKHGGTGEETGLVVKTYKMVGTGRNAQLVEEWKIDPALVQLIDRLQMSTAEELGQLPRPDQNINLKALMLVRNIDGGTESVD